MPTSNVTTRRLTPRYDRIVPLVLLVVLGLTVLFWIDSNPDLLRIEFAADIPPVALSWVLVVLLAVLASTGADLLARSHPEMQTRTVPTLNLGFTRIEILPGLWILPALSVVGSFAFFRLFRESLAGLAFLLALLAVAITLLVVLIGQWYVLDRRTPVQHQAQFALQLVAYLLAAGCFSAVSYARLSPLYAALLVGICAALLAYDLLQWTARPRLLWLATTVGLLVAQAIWAITYWPTSFLVNGSVLLVLFYLMVSLLHHQASQTLQRRLIIEYGLLGSGLVAVVLYVIFMN
ncbi:MAG: hypothetical protein HC837_09480 [Chloroflexaceae bacterium]|nr:hypothetical protein [Chloroflexaceae bacterium]